MCEHPINHSFSGPNYRWCGDCGTFWAVWRTSKRMYSVPYSVGYFGKTTQQLVDEGLEALKDMKKPDGYYLDEYLKEATGSVEPESGGDIVVIQEQKNGIFLVRRGDVEEQINHMQVIEATHLLREAIIAAQREEAPHGFEVHLIRELKNGY